MNQPNACTRIRSRRRGSAIIEGALVLSVLLSLSFGAIEFGYFYYVKNMFSDAARQGARAGAPMASSNSQVQTAVTNVLGATNWPPASYTVSITDTSGNTVNVSTLPAGSAIQVTVSAAWGTIGAGFRPLSLIGSNKQVAGVAVFRKEG